MRFRIIAFFFSVFSLSAHSQVSQSFYKADSLLLNQYYTEAIDLLEQLAEKDTTSPVIYFKLGQAYSGLMKYKEAFRVYNRANELDPENRQILYALGETCISLGALNKATQCYFSILMNESDQVKAYLKLGYIYQKQKEYLRALGIYFPVLGLDPDNFVAYNEMGKCYQNLNQYPEAIWYYEKALSINPLDITLYSLIGNLYIKMEKYPDAIGILNRGLESDSLQANLLKLKSFAHLKNHENEKAVEGFEKLIALGDSSLFVAKHLGLSYIGTEQYNSAIPLLEQVFKNDSTDYENCYFLATAYSGDYQKIKAQKYFFRTIDLLQPDSILLSLIHYKIAENYYYYNTKYLALEHYEIALKLDTTNIPILFKIASCYQSLDNKKEAIKCYDLALDFYKTVFKLDNSEMTILLKIASDYNYLGEKKKALDSYNLVLKQIDKFRDQEEIGFDNNNVKEFVQSRIRKLREELHFEGGLNEK